MINNKRGLSDVVTTVLIILLAIAAVVIVWSFVAPTLRGAGEKLNISCIQTDLEITNCLYNPAIPATATTDSVAHSVDITYQLKAKEGDLTGVKISISDGSTSKVIDGIAPEEVLETETETFSSDDLSELTFDEGSELTASIIPVIKEEACSAETAKKIVCK